MLCLVMDGSFGLKRKKWQSNFEILELGKFEISQFQNFPIPIMNSAYVTVTILLMLPAFCVGQLHWKKVSNGFDSLPRSIRIFKTTDPVNGRPFIAWCA